MYYVLHNTKIFSYICITNKVIPYNGYHGTQQTNGTNKSF